MKLGFLWQVINSNYESLISGHVILALREDIDALCLVKECRKLEQYFHSNFTNYILRRNIFSFKEMKKIIYGQDRRICVANLSGYRRPLL